MTRSLAQSLVARGVKVGALLLALRIRYEGVVRSDMEAARAIFEALLQRGIHPNQYHYSALMEGYTYCADMVAATKILAMAERGGIQPNVVMYTILICGYARQGDPQASLRTFQQMVTSGIRPDVPSIDAVANAFFTVGAFGIARHVLTSLWSHIAPFPDDLRGASLHEMAHRFRSLHEPQPTIAHLTKCESIELHSRLKIILDSWRKVAKKYGF